MRDAFRKMRRFLMTTRQLTEDEAVSLISVAVDFGVTQVVDGNWGIHALIKKNLFPELHKLHPGRIINQTNGVTPRRWLRKAR